MKHPSHAKEEEARAGIYINVNKVMVDTLSNLRLTRENVDVGLVQ